MIVCAVIVCYVLWSVLRRHIPSNIEYQGEQIRLSKFYTSYEDYKDDPDNIDPSENSRVSHLVREAPIASTFSDRKEMIDALFKVKFPGYGAGPFSEFRQADGTMLDVSFIEIPRAAEDRVFTFHASDGKYRLLDDFVLDGHSSVKSARLELGNVIYELADGKPPLVRPARTSAQK